MPSQFVRSNGYCEAHDPESGAETMSKRGKKGGSKPKYPGVQGISEPESFEDLRQILGKVAVKVAQGEMKAKTANAISRVSKVWLTAQEKELGATKIAELEERMQTLREKVREQRRRPSQPWEN